MQSTTVLAFSYLRFSSPEQAKGDSVRRQTEVRNRWLERHPEVTLDTSLVLLDEGISGHTGQHRENPDRHALARFLALVESGRIAKGSYLIVENLDRLTREDILDALTLVLSLIRAGIRIVQLHPIEQVFEVANLNPMVLMMAIMELSRGHSESAMKSVRLGGAWENKKRNAAKHEVCHKQGGTAITARCPNWLTVADGKYVKTPYACEIVARIFDLCIEGHGIGAITRKLNAERVPFITRGKKAAQYWARSYVAKILYNRAVIGEYQPYTRRGGKRRKHHGEPIPNYYPAVINEQTWYAAHAALTSRKGKVGRTPKAFINPFAGLLRDAFSGGTVQLSDKGKRGGKVLHPYRGHQGVVGCRSTSFPYPIFEKHVLDTLAELDPKDIIGNGEVKKVNALTGELSELDKLIASLTDALDKAGGDVLPVVKKLKDLQQRRDVLVVDLAAAQQAAATPLATTWTECQSLVKLIDDDPAKRIQLRAALRRILDSVWCLFTSQGCVRIATVQLVFTGARHDERRTVTIIHDPGTRGALAGIRLPHTDVSTELVKGKRAVKIGDLREPGVPEVIERSLLRVVPTRQRKRA